MGIRLLCLRLAIFISLFYPVFTNTLQGIFSDECSVASNTSNPLGWVWRFLNKRYDKKIVNITNHGKADITIMIWGVIWIGKRSEIVIMKRNKDSSGNRYTT